MKLGAWLRQHLHPRAGPLAWRGARLGLALVLALALFPARAIPSQATLQVTHYLYVPALVNTGYTYLPLIQMIGDRPLDIIANPSFENEFWITDGFGNQDPAGWTFYSPAAGQVMPFPTKRQGGSTVPAISGGQGEYVHKYWWQLPENERVGGVRGLILEGDLTYKVFSDHIAHALRLSQTLTYTPGRWVKVTGHIVGETNIFVCSGGSGLVEDDTFIGSVQLGDEADTRFFKEMTAQHDVPGNERPWNKFSVTAQVPDNGQLLLTVIAQSNWACPVDFFIDDFEAFEVPEP